MSKRQPLQLKNQLCFALYAATHAIIDSYRAGLGRVGLTYPQYLVLLVLWETDGMTVKGLAERLSLESSTITPLLTRLQVAGLVTRRRNRADARVVNVFLTAAGRGLRREVARVQHGVACRTGLSSRDFFDLRDRLYRLIEALNKTQPGKGRSDG